MGMARKKRHSPLNRETERSLLEVEAAEHGVVEFVATDFEIHFGAIDRAGAKIVEPDDDFFLTLGFQHQTRRPHDG